MINRAFEDDLLSRGYSRRQMMRAAALFGGATALAFNPERALAATASAAPKVRIGLNECWAGPMAPGIAAAAGILSQCNRYSPNDEQGQLIKTISKVENIPEDHIMVWPGSNEALARSVLAYCSPTKSLVQADVTYETAGTAAKWLGAPIKTVPLKADFSHDVKAMLAADPKAGLYYVCSPNNPTGTVTPMADIEWLVNNKPAGSMVVIDEAYIHFTSGYPGNTATHLARAGKDVLIMRTFSKIFGMAGMRVGYFMARPDIVRKMALYDDGALATDLPIPSIACANASLTATSMIAARRKELDETRAMTVDFLTKRGLRLIGPSQANMQMVDWKTKTSKQMKVAFAAQGVEIARVFPAWPTVSRITIGSKTDMEGFFNALNKVMSA
ncbi:MAG: aminotransferase class I/II-fold pyridoxal phosphate-dependent enzyme [Rhizomicrobium sp.]